MFCILKRGKGIIAKFETLETAMLYLNEHEDDETWVDEIATEEDYEKCRKNN